MKNLYLILILLFATTSFAQNWISTGANNKTKSEVSLISSSSTQSTINYKINAYKLIPVTTQNGSAFTVEIPDAAPELTAGLPNTPSISRSLIISDDANMDVVITKSKYIELLNIEIAPSKGNITRDIDPSTVPYTYGKVYSENKFFPENTVTLQNPYIARDYRGQVVTLNPVQYNPITKTLRIYTDITIEVKENGKNSINAFNRTNVMTDVEAEFNKIYSRHFLNYNQAKYTALEEEGRMLILCHADYMEAMADFVAWKTRIGMSVELVDVSTAGSSASAIKTYVADAYNTDQITYLLLVGDAQHIPTNSGSGLGGPSDNAYGYITGNDHYQEIFVGRFSAESVADVETQVIRTLDYEQANFTATDWLNKSMGIASSEGPGDDGEKDYEHYRNMDTDLVGFTYSDPSYELFQGSQGGNDLSGDPSPSDVAGILNGDGAGILLYTGHGSASSFVTSGFSNGDVDNLTNAGQLPFIISVACVNGEFVGQTCFAEKWMRATDGSGNATGAVATIMATINQSWTPPMQGQDEMVDIMTESYTDNIKRTFGGVTINGCFLMNDESGSGGYDMTDTWTIFGDPSLMLRTDNPSGMTVSHIPTMFLGSNSFDVSCDFEDALVALTRDGEIIATARVTGGVASLEFDAIVTPGDISVAVTGFNKVPYLTIIPAVPADTPYITITEYFVNETDGNGNSAIDFGETVAFDITFDNISEDHPATGATATIATEDEFVTITQNSCTIGDIIYGTPVSLTEAFVVELANNIPNNHRAIFTVTIDATEGSDSYSWESSVNFVGNAPSLTCSFVETDVNNEFLFASTPTNEVEAESLFEYQIAVAGTNGDNNGLLDPGETVELIVIVANEGNATSPSAICTMSTENTDVTIEAPTAGIEPIDAAASQNISYVITIDPNAAIGSVVEFVFEINYGEYVLEETIKLPVGLSIEDFESGDFSSYAWTQGGDADWSVIDSESHQGSYSAKSDSIFDNQTSELSIEVDVTTDDQVTFWYKVSSEESYDELHFYIDGTDVSGSGYSGDIDWTEVSFPVSAGTHTLKWSYEKDGSVDDGQDCAWIDDIILPAGAAKKSNSTKTLEISVTDKPDWLTFTDNGDGTALLSGTPTRAEIGNHDIALSATNGTSSTTQEFSIDVTGTVLSVDQIENGQFNASIYPNPVATNATISLTVMETGKVSIAVYDIAGKQVATIANKNFAAGNYEITLNNVDLKAGTYILKAVSNNSVSNQKFVVNK